jgi:SpoVK/Ycf46/Vps4 family AAA+-type ATPase
LRRIQDCLGPQEAKVCGLIYEYYVLLLTYHTIDLADTDPVHVSNVTFESIGGLDDHVRSLKEMVVMPLLYPEVFSGFQITPPRGVLFYGPPGTGKTLMGK